jgi:hypothetical protein
MSDMYQKPEPPSGSTAEERSWSIEERLAYYAHLEENTYDAFIATDGHRRCREGCGIRAAPADRCLRTTERVG